MKIVFVSYFLRDYMTSLGFPGGSVAENLPASAGGVGPIPMSERSPGGGKGNLPEYSCPDNSTDRRAWWATVHGPQRLRPDLMTAAATAKTLQSCPTLCDPIDGSPPGSPVPGILQARTLEWVAIAFSNAGKEK